MKDQKLITIPYEEYQELRVLKSVAEDDVTMIREETNAYGNFYQCKYVYTKDIAIERLSQELKEAKEELARINDMEEKISEPPYKKMFYTLAFFNAVFIFA